MTGSRYFDANATTPLSAAARAAWIEASDAHWHNPASPYRAAAQVHARLENARADLPRFSGTDAARVVFNSGATEGNRDALAYGRRLARTGDVLVTSAVEHPSVLENARALWGQDIVVLPVDPSGVVDFGRLIERLDAGSVAMVSLMAANNETGTLQPWAEAVDLCRERGVLIHVDASQWIGREPLGGLARADLVTGCAHKFGGPKGTGFVLVAPTHAGFTGQRGGAQENDHRAGTPDYPSIAAMLAALQGRESARAEAHARLLSGRDAFESALRAALPEVRFWGADSPRLANTSSVLLPAGHGDNARWVRRLDRAGFLVSTGSACATGKEGPSHVLAALGATPEQARRTIRVSALPEATSADWLALAEAIIVLARDDPDAGAPGVVISR